MNGKLSARITTHIGGSMSERSSKKLRRQMRKRIDMFSKGVMGRTTFTVARQRDIITIIALCELAVIILLGLWIVL